MLSERNSADGWECVQVLNRFFYHLDEFQYEELLGLMPDDGSWFRQGELLRGRERILKTLQERSRTQRIRHIITNTIVDVKEPGKASGIAYLTVYKFDDGAEVKRPPVIDAPFRLSLVHAQFAKTADQWRITDLRVEAQFEFCSRESKSASAASPAKTDAAAKGPK